MEKDSTSGKGVNKRVKQGIFIVYKGVGESDKRTFERFYETVECVDKLLLVWTTAKRCRSGEWNRVESSGCGNGVVVVVVVVVPRGDKAATATRDNILCVVYCNGRSEVSATERERENETNGFYNTTDTNGVLDVGTSYFATDKSAARSERLGTTSFSFPYYWWCFC